MLKVACCHYSLHRRWKDENWDIDRLTDEVKALGIEGIDYHAGLLGSRDGVVEAVQSALDRSGLELSGFSLSTNFNREDPDELRAHVEDTLEWLQVAAELNAPVSRIFGGHVDRSKPELIQTALHRITETLGNLASKAEAMGLVLALENHGGLPCTGEEQAQVIEAVNSPALKATIDVGNYMSCGQEGVDGTRAVSRHTGYVHIKDMQKTPDGSKPHGWSIKACTIGQGDVDIPECLRLILDAGYEGYMALEYEGPEPEETGVPASIEYMKKVAKSF